MTTVEERKTPEVEWGRAAPVGVFRHPSNMFNITLRRTVIGNDAKYMSIRPPQAFAREWATKLEQIVFATTRTSF